MTLDIYALLNFPSFQYVLRTYVVGILTVRAKINIISTKHPACNLCSNSSSSRVGGATEAYVILAKSLERGKNYLKLELKKSTTEI